MLWFILVIILISVIFYKLNEYYCVLALFKRVRKEDGSKLDIVAVPGVLPHFGNTFDLLNWPWTEKHRILVKLFNYARINHLFAKGKSYLLYFAGFPVYNITNAEDSAELFQSSQILAKGIFYEFLKLFLGDGLVISTGKMVTDF